MELLNAYLPRDRRQALARGVDLADRTHGAALFADISGFTPLTAAQVEELGPQRGAEELTLQLNQVYGAFIAELHRCRASVLGFGGDAITCWLDGDGCLLSTACALAMQRAVAQFTEVRTPAGTALMNLGIILLQERAAKIEDGEMQRSFLEDVAAHRELVREFARAG